jgi:hypothetical protein
VIIVPPSRLKTVICPPTKLSSASLSCARLPLIINTFTSGNTTCVSLGSGVVGVPVAVDVAAGGCEVRAAPAAEPRAPASVLVAGGAPGRVGDVPRESVPAGGSAVAGADGDDGAGLFAASPA